MMAQAGPKFQTHSFKKTFLLLDVCVHMIRSITGQLIENLDIFSNSLISLLKVQKLTKLNLYGAWRDVVGFEGCAELCPGDSVPCRQHSKKGLPPRGGRASKLMSGKQSLLLFCTYWQLKLGFHQSKPAVGLEWVFSFGKGGWMCSRKITVRGSLGLPLTFLKLLLLYLILGQHLEYLGLLS